MNSAWISPFGQFNAGAIVAYKRSVAVTNAATPIIATVTVPTTADGSFQLSYDALILSGATFSFTVEAALTDEGGTARVFTLDGNASGSGTGAAQYSTTIVNTAGVVAYGGRPLRVRCKAGTTITLRTSVGGTYTDVVYNIEGFIEQFA